MRRTVILIFLSLVLTASLRVSGQDKTFDEANELYAAQKYAEAEAVYRRLLGSASETSFKAKIVYNLGMTYVQLKRFEDAETQFRTLLSMKVDNREASGNITRPFRNYHYNAQMEIAKIQYENGDFAGALESFRNARTKYPFQSFCGNCISEENHKVTLYEAATLEHLGRSKEAFELYFRIGHPRLVEIYAANDRLEQLTEIVKKKNKPQTDEAFKAFFMAYELGKAGEAAALLNELRELAKTRQDSYLKDWTARMLARNAQTAVPLIEAELKNPKTYPYVFYRTLGFAATPEAMEILKARAEKAAGWYDAEAIAASFLLAGEAGANAVKQLEKRPLGKNMKLALEKMKSGELTAKNYIELEFAPLKTADLPSEF
jgi:tetratricopeptide (TPR) repeat protein